MHVDTNYTQDQTFLTLIRDDGKINDKYPPDSHN